MRPGIVQFAKTAALCAVLGLGLYLVVEALAASPHRERAAAALGGVLSSALIVLLGPMFVEAWRTGCLPAKSGSILREKEPVWYSIMMTLHAASIAGSAAVAIYCAARLISW